MQTPTIIERAFELARELANVDDIRKVLRREGYSNIDAHLAGASIKADLKRQFSREGGPAAVPAGTGCGAGAVGAPVSRSGLSPSQRA